MSGTDTAGWRPPLPHPTPTLEYLEIYIEAQGLGDSGWELSGYQGMLGGSEADCPSHPL